MEGLEKARDLKPELIFLDLVMPDRSGAEILDAIKNETALKNIPVVISTSCALQNAERERLLQKAVSVLNKDKLVEIDFRALVRNGGRSEVRLSGVSGD